MRGVLVHHRAPAAQEVEVHALVGLQHVVEEHAEVAAGDAVGPRLPGRATLGDLFAALGDRDVVMCRELTKLFETIARVPLSRAVDWVKADENRSRGEFVLVIEGRPVETKTAVDPLHVLEVLLAELSVKQTAALASKITGVNRSELYQRALAMKGEDAGKR